MGSRECRAPGQGRGQQPSPVASRAWAARRLSAAGLAAFGLVACARADFHHDQAVDSPIVLPPAAAVQAPPVQAQPAGMVDALFYRETGTGRLDGPFDPSTGQRLLLHPVPDGSAAVLVDPVTGLPVLLPDRADPAPGWEATRRPLPIFAGDPQ